VVKNGAQPNASAFAPSFPSARPIKHGIPLAASVVEVQVDAIHWLRPLALVPRHGALANASVFARTHSSARVDKPGILQNASARENAQTSVLTAPPPPTA